MRSIFGKCIAIAMMAAIALVFHSPPVQASGHQDNRDDAREHARDAKDAATEAEAHAADTKAASDAAEASAEATREAADDAATAAQAVEDAEDSTTDQQDEASDAMDDAADAATAAETAAGNTVDPVPEATIASEAIDANDNAASISALADALAGEDDDDSATAATGAFDVNESTDPTTTAWALANYAKDQAAAASDVDLAADNAVNLANAENAADDAAARRDAAEIASDAALAHADTAEEQYAEALDAVRLAVAIAQDATEAAAVAAEAEAVEEPSAVNTLKAERARTAANDAAAAAEKYAADAGDDDDDDSTPMGDAAVTANGVGNMLQFGYWTTMGKDTLVAVTNLGDAEEEVKVAVMDDMGMAAGTITVCLAAGDTWTSAIISSGESTSSVMGGNPGECSGATPDMALDATSGFIEVSTMDGEGSLMGLATLVNATDGYASTYNATSLNVAAEGDVADALAMEGNIQKDMLLGRWGADAMIGGMTQIMLTFPVAGTAPMQQVAIEVTDEMGTSMVVTSMMLDKAVNMCTFATDAMDATMLSCNGSEGVAVTPAEGWFKITAPDDMMGFSVIGMVSQSFDGTSGMFDQSYPVQWMEMPDMDMME